MNRARLLVPVIAMLGACGGGGSTPPGPDATDPGPVADVVPDAGPSDPGPADVPADAPPAGPPPWVLVTEPPPGTFATGCGEPLPVGFRVTTDRTVAKLTLQGQPLPPATGDLDGTFRPAQGLNLITVEATDDLGRAGRSSRALLCGSYAPASSTIPHAADLYLGKGAFDAMSDLAVRLFDELDLTALFTAKDPLFANDFVVIRPGSLSHRNPSEIAVIPAWDQLMASFVIHGLRASLRIEIPGKMSGTYDVSVASDLVRVDATARVVLDGDGTLAVALDDLRFDLGDVQIDIAGIVEDLLAVFPDVKQKVIDLVEAQLADAVYTYLPKAVSGALARLTEPIHASFLGRDFSLRFAPTQIQSSPGGLHLALDVAIEGLTPDPAVVSPGVLRTPGDEAWPAVDGVRLSLKDDLLNGVFHEAWRSGLLAFTVDQAFIDGRKLEIALVAGFLGNALDALPAKVDPETPISVVLAPAFPPVASMDLPAQGGVRVGLGDLGVRVVRASDGTAILPLTLTLRLEARVSPTGAGGVEVGIDTFDVALDVDDPDGRYAGTEAYVENTARELFGTVGSLLTGLIGPIPVPAFEGFTLANLAVGTDGADGGTLSITADLVEVH